MSRNNPYNKAPKLALARAAPPSAPSPPSWSSQSQHLEPSPAAPSPAAPSPSAPLASQPASQAAEAVAAREREVAARLAEVERREAAAAAAASTGGGGGDAALAEKLAAAEDRIFELEAEQATIEVDAKFQIEKGRETLQAELKFKDEELAKSDRALQRATAQLRRQAEAAAAAPAPAPPPPPAPARAARAAASASGGERGRAVGVVFGERRDAVARLSFESPALRRAVAALAAGDEGASVGAVLDALGAVAAAAESGGDGATDAARVALEVGEELLATCPDAAADEAACAPRARAGGRGALAAAALAAAARPHALRVPALRVAAAAAAARDGDDAWWRPRCAAPLGDVVGAAGFGYGAAAPRELAAAAAAALDLASTLAAFEGDAFDADAWPAVAALCARAAEAPGDAAARAALRAVVDAASHVAALDARRAAALLAPTPRTNQVSVAAALVRAANDADAADGDSPLAAAVVALLGHVVFFSTVALADLFGFHADALAYHELLALCERAKFASPNHENRDADCVIERLGDEGHLRLT